MVHIFLWVPVSTINHSKSARILETVSEVVLLIRFLMDRNIRVRFPFSNVSPTPEAGAISKRDILVVLPV